MSLQPALFDLWPEEEPLPGRIVDLRDPELAKRLEREWRNFEILSRNELSEAIARALNPPRKSR